MDLMTLIIKLGVQHNAKGMLVVVELEICLCS